MAKNTYPDVINSIPHTKIQIDLRMAFVNGFKKCLSLPNTVEESKKPLTVERIEKIMVDNISSYLTGIITKNEDAELIISRIKKATQSIPLRNAIVTRK